MAAALLPGLEAIRKIAAGELPPPPIASAARLRDLAVVEEGRVIFAFTPAEWMYNPIGSVHGGVAATLLDSSLGLRDPHDAGGRAALHDVRPAGPLRAGA